MNKPCNCYYGEDCTKTTVCANEGIVEDLEEMIENLIDELEVERETIAQLEAQIGMLESDG